MEGKKLIIPLSPNVDLRLKTDKLYNDDLYFDTTPILQPIISNTNDTIDVNLVNRHKQAMEHEREEFTYRDAHSHISADAGYINKQHDAVGSSEEESTNRDAEDIVLTINVQRSQVLKTDKGSYNFMNVKDFLKNKLPVDGLNYTRRFEFIPGRTIRSIFRLNGKMDYVGLIDSGASCSLIPLSVYRSLKTKHNNSLVEVITPPVKDASGANIKLYGGIKIKVGHILSAHPADISFYIYPGNMLILGVNVLQALNIDLFFRAEGTYLQFAKREKVFLAKATNSGVVASKKFQTLHFEVPALKNKNNVDCVVYQAADELKCFPPSLLTVKKGKFSIETYNSSEVPTEYTNISAMVEVYDKDEYAVSNAEEGKNQITKDNFKPFDNYIDLNESNKHLMGMYSLPLEAKVSLALDTDKKDRDELSEDELFNHIGRQGMHEIDPNEYEVYDHVKYRKNYYSADELKQMFDKYDPEVRDRLVKIFTKHHVLALHAYDRGKLRYPVDFHVNRNFERNSKIYPMSAADQSILRKYLDLLLMFNIIEKAPQGQSFGSPIFLISRKNGSRRLIIDSRKAFKTCLTEPPSVYMTSVLESIKSKIGNAGKLSSLDLKNCYYNLEVSQEVLDSGVQNFICLFGAFRFRSALTGAANSPQILLSYLAQNMHVDKEGFLSYLPWLIWHFDDLSVWSSKETSVETHLDRLEILAERLDFLGFKVSYEKSDFYADLCQTSVPLLGFLVGHKKVSIPSERKEAILKMEAPCNLTQAQSFLGMANFLRNIAGADFCDHISRISRFLYPFQWNDVCETSFQAIKNRLREDDLYLTTPTTNDLIFIFSDASDYSIGGAALAIDRHNFNLTKEREDKFKFTFKPNNAFEKYMDSYKIKVPVKVIMDELKLYELVLNISLLYEGVMGETIYDIKKSVQRGLIVYGPKLCLLVEDATCIIGGKQKYNTQRFKQFVADVVDESITMDERIHMVMLTVAHTLGCNVHMYVIGLNRADYICIGEFEGEQAIWITYNMHTYKFCLLALIGPYKNYKKTELCITFEKDLRLIKNHLLANLKNPSDQFKNNLRIIGFCGKSLNDSLRRASTYTKESAALLFTLNFFQDFFQANNVIALSDSDSIVKYVNGEKDKPRDQTKMSRILNEIVINYSNIGILHLAGVQNGVSDALSRCIGAKQAKRFRLKEVKKLDVSSNSLFFENTNDYFDFIMNLKDKYEKPTQEVVNLLHTSHLEELFQKYLSVESQKGAYQEEFLKEVRENKQPQYFLRMDRVFHRETELPVLPVKLYSIYASYIHATKGHKGVKKMKMTAERYFFITNKTLFHEKVDEVKQSCLSCLTAIPPNVRYFRGLISAPYANHTLAMDFLERGGLIKNTKRTLYSSYLLIVTCVYSKYTQVYLFNGLKVSTLIHSMFNWISSHGKCRYLLHDNGQIFLAKEFQQFLQRFGIKSLKSTPYRSQARGGVERFVREIREHYRKHAGDETSNYDFWEYVPSLIQLNNGLPIFENYSPTDLFFKSPYVETVDAEIRKVLPVEKPDAAVTSTDKEMYKKIYDRALKRQAQLNKKLKSKTATGSFYLIKDLRKRVGDGKNKAYFFEIPYVCIGSSKTNLILASLINGTQVRRHVSDVKRLDVAKINNLRFSLPKALVQSLNLVDLEMLTKIPALAKKRDRGVTTRAKAKAAEENETISDDEALMDDIMDNEVMFDIDNDIESDDEIK